MINLIPQSGKQIARREYVARVAVTYMFLATFAVFIAALLLLPSYLYVMIESRTLQSSVDTISDEQAEIAALETELASASALLAGIESFESISLLMPSVYDLDELAGSDIILQNFSVRRTDAGDIEEITISGTADTRVALASFESRLEASATFGEVVIPLANLARDQNIPFTLEVPILSQQ